MYARAIWFTLHIYVIQSLFKLLAMTISRNIFLIFALLATACAYSETDVVNGETDVDWVLYGNGYHNQRFSPLSQINRDSVARLKLVWKHQTGKKNTFQASPIVKNGIMYITTPFNDVVALDADTGQQRWRYRHQLSNNNFCCGPANRGAAIANGKVLMVTIDGRLIALDQSTGTVVWDTVITEPMAGNAEVLNATIDIKELKDAIQTGQTGYSANLAPQVYDGLVYIGITGAGYGLHLSQEKEGETVLSVGSFAGGKHGLRGFVAAYDIETGARQWRWYSVPEVGWEGAWTTELDYGETLNRNLSQEKKQFEQYADAWQFGGGSIWTTPAIDPELGLLYVGTGNPSPQMEGSTRPGDNLYTVSLVALELKTGKMRWYYQQVPHDRWGYDVASPPVLFDYHDGDRLIKAVGQASKLGWFFIHDRATGKLIRRSAPFVRQENLFALPSADGTRIVPGTLGATSWSPVAYSPQNKWVYITGIYQPSLFFSRKLTPQPQRPWQGYTFFQKTDEDDWGLLTAIDVQLGHVVWQNKLPDPMVGGVLATAGQLVFTGEGNGHFNAYDAITGQLLWQYLAQYGVNAPPISYRIDGKQYISVAAGGNKLYGYKTGDEILTFSLQDD